MKVAVKLGGIEQPESSGPVNARHQESAGGAQHRCGQLESTGTERELLPREPKQRHHRR